MKLAGVEMAEVRHFSIVLNNLGQLIFALHQICQVPLDLPTNVLNDLGMVLGRIYLF